MLPLHLPLVGKSVRTGRQIALRAPAILDVGFVLRRGAHAEANDLKAVLLIERTGRKVLAEGEERKALGRSFHGFAHEHRSDACSLRLDRNEELIDQMSVQRQHADDPPVPPCKPDLALGREGIAEVLDVALERVLLHDGNVRKSGALAGSPHGDSLHQILGLIKIKLQRHGERCLSMVRWQPKELSQLVTPEHCRLMARYNRWMNEKLYTLSAGLPDAERKKDRRAFFRSIHGTLNHLLLGDRIWLGRFVGRPFQVKSLAEELCSDFDELREERSRTDDEIDAFVAGLTSEKLAASFAYRTLVDPQERSTPLWILTTHFFNHQTHHRGQLTNLLSQCGLDPGITDLLWLPDHPDASSHARPEGGHRGR